MALTDKLTAIAEAIRGKTGGSDLLTLDEMAVAIEAIEAGAGQDNTVVEFSQINTTVQQYIDASSCYTDANYADTTVMSNYSPGTTENYALEKPLGYDITVRNAGTLYIVDEETGKGNEPVDVSAGAYTIYNLIPGHIYRWIIKDSTGSITQAGRLKSTGDLRYYYMPSVHNFRDMGGWDCDGGKTRYGLLLRGGQLSNENAIQISEADKARFRDFGILAEVDLRDIAEVDRDTEDTSDDINSCPAGDYISYVRYQMSYHATSMQLGTSNCKTTVACLRNIMSNVVKGIPTYFHCAAGADRTGTIAIILEALAGVSCADCSRDYELTALVPYYADRLRTNSSFTGQADYINSFDGDTFAKKCAWWAVQAGIPVGEINAFRAAFSNGTPEVLSFPMTISTNLTSCSIDNNADSAEYGEAYTAYISTNDGYYLDFVTVTMGGEDISASAVSSDLTKISIEKVTGAVVITAVASVPSQIYSITSNLTHCSNNNSLTSVSEGSSYSAIITADTYYELSTVSCTMGGDSVSVTDGVISIDNVTGDIVIIAVAAQKNYASEIGWTDNARLSTSTGEERDASGYVAIGYIPVEACKITIKGIDWSKGHNSYDGLVCFNASKVFSTSTYMNAVIRSGKWAILKDTTLSDNVLTFVLDPTLNSNIKYIRISGYGIGSGLEIYKESV